MAWRDITEADILQRLSGAELEALRAAALGDGQADPVASAIPMASDMVRGYISAGGFALGAGYTLPERLILPAVDFLVVDISTRAAGLLIDSDGHRAAARKDAIRLFERVADGRYAVEAPVDADTEGSAASAPLLAVAPRRFTRAAQDGI